MKIKEKDLKVLKKVTENISEYEWHNLTPESRYYSIVEFPTEAERRGNSFYAEITSGLTIVVGAYSSRFYYEEDNFAWEKKYYAAIISIRNFTLSSIAFITHEDLDSLNRKHSIFKLPTFLETQSFEDNIIVSLYDVANREASGVEELYDDFLEDE